MFRIVYLTILLIISGCSSTEPTVITKTIFNVTEIPNKQLYAAEAKRRAAESPAELLDPFYTRLKYYLKIEAEVNLLYDKLEAKIYSEVNRPAIKLMPVQGKIKGAKYQDRANTIISEFIRNRIEAYDFDNNQLNFMHKKSWSIHPTLKMRNGNICLQLQLKDENNLEIPILGANSDTTDYFFFNYVDGIRFD